MKLNVYKNQKEIEKTYEVDTYDIMYGTVEDIFEVIENGMDDVMDDENKLLMMIVENRSKLEDLLLDIFSEEGLTKEELRKVKVKEMIPLFIELFAYVKKSFESKN